MIGLSTPHRVHDMKPVELFGNRTPSTPNTPNTPPSPLYPLRTPRLSSVSPPSTPTTPTSSTSRLQWKADETPTPKKQILQHDTAVCKIQAGSIRHYGGHSKHNSPWNLRWSTQHESVALIYAENNDKINVRCIHIAEPTYLINLNHPDVFEALYKPKEMRAFFESESMYTGTDLEEACNCIRRISKKEEHSFEVSFDDLDKPAYGRILETGELRRYSEEKMDKAFTDWFDNQLPALRVQFNEPRLTGFCVELKGHHQEEYYSEL